MQRHKPDERLKFFAFGNVAVGFIAVGNVAIGVVAIGGALSVGPIALGMNSVGILLALGLNAVGTISIAAINALGVFSAAGVNALGAKAFAFVNFGQHPVVALLMLAVQLGVLMKLRVDPVKEASGRETTRLANLVSGQSDDGTVRARILSVSNDVVEIEEDEPGRERAQLGLAQSMPASGVQGLAEAGNTLLITITATKQVTSKLDMNYRRAPEVTRQLVAAAFEALPAPPKPWARPDAIRRFSRMSLYAGTAISIVTFVTSILWT
jgi:hypothetical protein